MRWITASIGGMFLMLVGTSYGSQQQTTATLPDGTVIRSGQPPALLPKAKPVQAPPTIRYVEVPAVRYVQVPVAAPMVMYAAPVQFVEVRRAPRRFPTPIRDFLFGRRD